MHLTLLTFGADLRNHYQANFCVLTFLKENPSVATVDVFTDQPELCAHLGDRVVTTPVDERLLSEWKGEHGFFWRVKIKALETLVERYGDEPVLYVDADTFLTGDLDGLRERLSGGGALMHENEGKLSEIRPKTTTMMWKQVKDRTFGGIRMTDDLCMWNAGVVGLPGQRNGEAVRLALRICDEMCAAAVTPRLIEQFALSVALDALYEVRPARPWIGHYWDNKPEWNRLIASFFAESALRDLTLEEKLERLRDFDFRQIPVRKRDRTLNRRLHELTDRFLPPRNVGYHDE